MSLLPSSAFPCGRRRFELTTKIVQLYLLVAIAAAAYVVQADFISTACKVNQLSNGKLVPCVATGEYEYEYEYETVNHCQRFTIDNGTNDPLLPAGQTLKQYQGKFWCATVKQYTGTTKNWGVCDPAKLPAICFPVIKTSKPTTRSPTRPTTFSPTFTKTPTVKTPAPTPGTARPTTLPPLKRGQTRFPTRRPTPLPTTLPTTSPTTSRPSQGPTTPAPTRKPTRPPPTRKPTTPYPSKSPTRSRPTKSPTRFPTKKPTKIKFGST